MSLVEKKTFIEDGLISLEIRLQVKLFGFPEFYLPLH